MFPKFKNNKLSIHEIDGFLTFLFHIGLLSLRLPDKWLSIALCSFVVSRLVARCLLASRCSVTWDMNRDSQSLPLSVKLRLNLRLANTDVWLCLWLKTKDLNRFKINPGRAFIRLHLAGNFQEQYYVRNNFDYKEAYNTLPRSWHVGQVAIHALYLEEPVFPLRESGLGYLWPQVGLFKFLRV